MWKFISQISRILKHQTFWALILLNIVCTSVNLTKPVHIDDTAHLEIALNILHDPFHPMSGQVNWGSETDFTALPAYHLNQPHLFFYLMALVVRIFGNLELAQHCLIAFMSSIVILFFYLISKIIVPQKAFFITALFILGPVFLPSQNIMVDVPTLAFWLIFFWAMFSAFKGRPNTYYLIGNVAVAVACLIKYTSITLLPIFLLIIILRRQWSSIWLIIIPVSALVGWSLFNYFDYGGIHILERQVSTPYLHIYERLLKPIFATIAWIIAVGAVASFNVIFLSRAEPIHSRRLNQAIRVSLFASVAIFITSSIVSKSFYTATWLGLFFANGVFTIYLVYQSLVTTFSLTRDTNNNIQRDRNLILLLWLAGAFLFIVLFAPFMAIRHVLLAVPAIILLLASNLEQFIEYRQKALGIILTAFLGITLAISDYNYAAVYRDYAYNIKMELPSNATIWYTGNWGWQWYASQQGMQQVDTKKTIFKDGDYLIIPELMASWKMIPPITKQQQQRMKKVKEVTANANALTLFRTMSKQPDGGYYSFSITNNSLPWIFSTDVLESFSIYRFDSIVEKGYHSKTTKQS